MSKHWQVVDENGELVDEDDSSSIGSDWSFMRVNSDFGSCSRANSVSGDCSSSVSSLDGGLRPESRSQSVKETRRSSLPNSIDPPVHEDPATRLSATSVRAVARNRSTTTGLVRPDAAASGSVVRGMKKSPNLNMFLSHKVASRWNCAVHANRRHRNTLNVDEQHAKCLRRGAQISHAFQRRQVQLAAGGQIPQIRRMNK
jgi:chromatin remodeling complex protein RSC6